MKGICRFCAYCTAVHTAFLPVVLAAATFIEISAVRVDSRPDSTLIALQLSGPVRFSSGRLSHPDRAIFDFPGSRPSIEGRREGTIKVDDPRLVSVRIGETMPGTTRVVLDLAANVTLTSKLRGNEVLIEVFGDPPKAIAPPAPKRDGSAPPGPVSTTQQNSRPATDAVPPPRNLFGEFSAADALPAVTFPIPRAGAGTYRIVLDPGHGGQDGGATRPGGLMEKDIALDISLRTAELLRQQPRTEVLLTRNSDQFVSLSQRTALANSAKADLLVSIHADSRPSSSASGVGAYYLALSDAQEDLDLAGRENATGDKTVADFAGLVKSISENEKTAESKLFAEAELSAMDAAFEPAAGKSGKRNARSAPFLVLVGAHMPAILLNINFPGSSSGDASLGSPEFRQKVAETLCLGIEKYRQTLAATPARP